MREKLRILIDAEALAVPKDDRTQASAEAYIRRLVCFMDLLTDDRFRLVRSRTAWETLEAAGRNPPWQGSPLDQMVADGDLLSLFLAVMERCATVESETGIRDLLVDEVRVAPGSHLEDRSDDAQEEYLRMLLRWWVVPSRHPHAKCAPVVTVGFSKMTVVKVAAELLAVDPPEVVVGDLPKTVRGASAHVSQCEALCKAIVPVHLFLNGSMELALLAEAAQRTGEEGSWLSREFRFSFHPTFAETAAAHDFFSDQARAARLLRACVDILTDMRRSQVHSIRESESGSAPQVVRARDGARAWRKDLDYEYHLHYWRRGDEFEFACVVDHDDMMIPE